MSCIRFSYRLFVLKDAYQWERYIVPNDIMVAAFALNLYEVETWERFRFVCPLGTTLILFLALPSLFFPELIGFTGLCSQQHQVFQVKYISLFNKKKGNACPNRFLIVA